MFCILNEKMVQKMIEKDNSHKGNSKKSPAVFLDRDGVLCKEKSYITRLEDLEIFPYTKDCIDEFHQKGCLAICITNQSAVARGMMSEDVLQEMNTYLLQQTGLDAIYYCPHHPNGTGPYRKQCSCRKPQTGMLQQAQEQFSIDMTHSYLVGDRASDVICGQNAGLKTVLLESGYGTKRLEQEVTADFVCQDLREFAFFMME
mgnify:CR=1 FL=1